MTVTASDDEKSRSGYSMKTNQLIEIREIFKRRGLASTLGGVLVGLLMARFIMVSSAAGVVVLSSAIALVFVVVLRKADYLMFGWLVLTSVIYFIMYRFFPPSYYNLLGTVLFWGLLVGVIGAWAIDNALSGRKFMPIADIPLPLVATIFVFLLWSALTLISSVDVYVSVKKWAHIVIALGASYMFFDFFARDENNIRRILKVISLVVIVVASLVITAAVRGLMSGTPIYKTISMWFWNPNLVGHFLFTFTPILLTCGFDFRPVKGFRFFLLAPVLLALFFSFSRTSWLAVLVSIAFLLWKSGRQKSALTAGLVAALVLAGMTVPVWREPFYDLITGPRYTGRQELWRAAWKVASDYPVFGTGLGNCDKFLNEYIEIRWLWNQNTHNSYLRNAADMGFFAAVLLLVFYVVFFYYSLKIERNLESGYLRLAVRGAIATYLGMFVHDMFGNGSILTAFDAAECHVLFPYVLMAFPFAARKLDERAKPG